MMWYAVWACASKRGGCAAARLFATSRMIRSFDGCTSRPSPKTSSSPCAFPLQTCPACRSLGVCHSSAQSSPKQRDPADRAQSQQAQVAALMQQWGNQPADVTRMQDQEAQAALWALEQYQQPVVTAPQGWNAVPEAPQGNPAPLASTASAPGGAAVTQHEASQMFAPGSVSQQQPVQPEGAVPAVTVAPEPVEDNQETVDAAQTPGN